LTPDFCPIDERIFDTPKNQKGVTSMITLPISPLVCSVLTTLILIVTFYCGRWCGIKLVMNRIEEEMEKNG